MCWEQICHKNMKFRATEEGGKRSEQNENKHRPQTEL